MAPPLNNRFKVVLIGDSGAGKTCLLQRYAHSSFSETYVSTIGVDVVSRNIDVDNKTVRLEVYDTAGQERFRSITASYYRQADGVMLVFDVTDEDSFQHILSWLADVEKYASSTPPVKLLVGAKCDLTDLRVVTADQGQELAKDLGIPYIESSAKVGVNVETSFMAMAVLMGQRASEIGTKKEKGINLGNANSSPRFRCCEN